ncbi:COBRA-like protein 1 [Tripterygium wilfordii]|nr:COBRA-like protein 1 [Tripterygium wilfordii]
MLGAFATQQGDCSNFKFKVPHSCLKTPVIADLIPEVSPSNKSEDCCRSGVLSAWTIDPSKSFSSFEMTVGNLPNSTSFLPVNLTLLAPGPGYTCSPVEETEPTKSSDIGGRREIQVFKTWKSTCTYSSFLGNKAPSCCVSLSTFYNPIVTTCPKCSCGCREVDQLTSSCIMEGSPLAISDGLDMVQCTEHMCPVRVHWHVSNNYMTHWRVKLTVSNYNYKRNYSDWNVVVQHPGFSQKAITYSFNSTLLPTVGLSDEAALFWGISYYNSELLETDETHLGSVTSDILFAKESDSFTLRNGWALPRRIYFNGEDCVMPLPDDFPMLPNIGSSIVKPTHHFLLLLLLQLLIFCSKTLVIWV